MKKIQLVLPALIAFVAAGSAFAQVAQLRNINGTVLVSQGDAMAAGSNGQSLVVGQRIVTTAGSQATINYQNGCDVVLRENQRFVVREANNCAVLIGAIEGTGVAGGAAAGGALFTGGSATAATVGTLALGAVGLGYAISRSDQAADASVR